MLSILSAKRGCVEDLRQRQVVACRMRTLHTRGDVRLVAHDGAHHHREDHRRTLQQGNNNNNPQNKSSIIPLGFNYNFKYTYLEMFDM